MTAGRIDVQPTKFRRYSAKEFFSMKKRAEKFVIASSRTFTPDQVLNLATAFALEEAQAAVAEVIQEN